ncbi:MAG: T9SS type A sorting domain-containing protein [Ignavibacteria bacterium]
MKKNIFIFFAILMTGSTINSAFAQKMFSKNFFGPMSTQSITDIRQSSDGGYFMTGTVRNSTSFFDMVLLKLDVAGNLIWNKAYGSTGGDFGYSVIESQGSGYVIAGSIWQYATNRDFYIVKTDPAGDTLWTRTYGSLGDDDANKILEIIDGYIIGGVREISDGTDISIIKITFAGDIEWSKNFYGPFNESLSDIILIKDGSVIITGSIRRNISSSSDILLMKISSTGESIWSKTYEVSDDDFGNSVYQTFDNGFILCGTAGTLRDISLLKTDSAGNSEWSKTFGGNQIDFGSKAIQLSDSAYILTGSYRLPNLTISSLLIKLNSIGDTLFSRIYIDSDSLRLNVASSLEVTNDNGFIMAGNPDMGILKTDSLGRSCKPYISGIPMHSIITYVNPIVLVEGSGLTETATIESVYSLKLETVSCSILTGLNPIKNNIHELHSLLQNYPNPFNPVTHLEFGIAPYSRQGGNFGFISLKVYDVLGNEVAAFINEKKNPGIYEVEFDGKDFPSGIYFYSLILDGNVVDTKRMILLK